MEDRASHGGTGALLGRAALAVLALAAVGAVVALIVLARSGPPATPAPGATEATEPAPPPRPLPLAGKIEPPPRGAYLGAYSPEAPFSTSALDRFESRAGKGVAIVMWYQPWDQSERYRFDAGTCAELMRRGKVPMITWEPWDTGGSNPLRLRDPVNQPKYRLARIIRGDHDDYIRQFARDVKELGGPVMLRPLHEMNGTWYPWSGTVNANTPKQYVRAWRHIHRLFQEEGATNVTWVWSINHVSVPDRPGNRFRDYYPGGEYVDWTAISGFNWGTSAPGTSWTSFSNRYREPLAYLEKVDKPICIAEFGCVEQGGDKADWLRDAYRQIRRRRSVKAIVYYDAFDRRARTRQDWRINSSKDSLRAFKSAIEPWYFRPTEPQALTDWLQSLTPADRQRLESIQPVY